MEQVYNSTLKNYVIGSETKSLFNCCRIVKIDSSLRIGMTVDEFFEGYSFPRNKELMRVFKDLDLVEHLGSGVPRILTAYWLMLRLVR